MSTTTIRLPDELKARVALAAQRAGTTAHSFIVEAISEKLACDERCGDFEATAQRRYADIVSTGKTIPWSEMRRYLEARVSSSMGEGPRASPRDASPRGANL